MLETDPTQPDDEDRLITYLVGRGFRFTADFCWIKPPSYVLTGEDCAALMTLFTDWGWAGLVEDPQKAPTQS